MSFNMEGKQCQVCKAYLFDNDDVVFCLDCGAPYHRECYDKIGRCFLESFHGTEQQYNEKTQDERQEDEHKKNEEKVNIGLTKCKMCDSEYEDDLIRCPECGTPNATKMGNGYAFFDFLGGVPADADLGEGVTANEAKKFVLSNSHRYIPKFCKMKLGKKISWNWLAFILPGPWMLSRKMYKLGAFFCTLSLVADIFAINFNRIVYENSNAQAAADLYEYFVANIGAFDVATLTLALAGSLISIFAGVISGMFGDYFYRQYTISNIRKIKLEHNNASESNIWRKKGGVNIVAMFIGAFVVMYLPEIIGAFLI